AAPGASTRATSATSTATSGRSSTGPRDELEHDAARVRDLEGALAPLLGLDRRRHHDSLVEQPRVLGIDIVDDEHDKQAVGSSGDGGRLERRKADPKEDQIETCTRVGQGHEAVRGHLLLETEMSLGKFS